MVRRCKRQAGKSCRKVIGLASMICCEWQVIRLGTYLVDISMVAKVVWSLPGTTVDKWGVMDLKTREINKVP